MTKLNASGTALVYSTYLGGSDDDIGTGIAVDALGQRLRHRLHLLHQLPHHHRRLSDQPAAAALITPS